MIEIEQAKPFYFDCQVIQENTALTEATQKAACAIRDIVDNRLIQHYI